jgi:hypothetical protein
MLPDFERADAIGESWEGANTSLVDALTRATCRPSTPVHDA